MVNKRREVKNTLGTSYNKKITRKKSVRKEAKCKQMYRELKIRRGKVILI